MKSYCMVVFAVVLAVAIGHQSALAVEVRPLMKQIGPIRVEVGKELHFTHGEVEDHNTIAEKVATLFPPAAPYIAPVVAKIKAEDRGNGVIVEVLLIGTVIGVNPR